MNRRAALIFAICAAPRLLALALFAPPAPTYYDELAATLLATGHFGFDGVPSTYIEPLYPAFLAAARMATGNTPALVLLLQIAVASGGGVLLYRLGTRLAGSRVGLFASLAYAFYPYLVRQSVAWLEITLCTTLAIAATWQLMRTERIRDAIACGVLFGLLMLARASFGLACLGAAIWLTWRGGLRLSVAMLAGVLAVQAPWMARNMRVDGSPFPSRIGENLYVSTSVYAGPVPLRDIDLLVPLALEDVQPEFEQLHLPPALEQRARDHVMLKRALAFVREHPVRTLWLKLRNALYLFTPQLLPRDAKSPEARAIMVGERVLVFNARPRRLVDDLLHGAAQAALLLFAAIGLNRRGVRAGDAPLLIILAANAAVCIVFFPTTRLMAPVMFVLMFYAGVGVEPFLGLRETSAGAPPRP